MMSLRDMHAGPLLSSLLIFPSIPLSGKRWCELNWLAFSEHQAHVSTCRFQLIVWLFKSTWAIIHRYGCWSLELECVGKQYQMVLAWEAIMND